jgi:hypothetical protein
MPGIRQSHRINVVKSPTKYSGTYLGRRAINSNKRIEKALKMQANLRNGKHRKTKDQRRRPYHKPQVQLTSVKYEGVDVPRRLVR